MGKYYTCAETAKFVRDALKEAFPGIKFSVKSRTYSMGASIDVKWFDGPTEDEFKAVTHKFEGSYMSNEYGGDSIKMPRHDTIDPVTGESCSFGANWVSGERSYTLAFYRPVVERLAAYYGCPVPDIEVSKDGSARITNDYGFQMDYHLPDTLSVLVWRELRTISGIVSKKKIVKGLLVVEAGNNQGTAGFWISGDTWPNKRTIKENGGTWHKESKRFFLAGEVIPEAIASLCKTSEETKQIQGDKMAVKFETLANNLQSEIDDKRRARDWNPTARRNRMDASRLDDARKLEELQDKLRALAILWREGSIPEILKGITNKGQLAYILDREQFKWCTLETLQKMGLGSELQFTAARAALAALGDPQAGKMSQAELIREEEKRIALMKIDGFFPTPRTLAEKMIACADIRAGMTVLEPSAGKGDIADVVPERDNLDVIEVSITLRELLQKKGYTLTASDFLEYSSKEYDRIVMNPPFENMQDVDHVKHAFDLLKPGGRIVAVMSESVFFRQGTKAESFRTWLEELNASAEKLPEKTFMESDKPTGVNARLVIIDKPERKEPPIKQDTPEIAAIRTLIANNLKMAAQAFDLGMPILNENGKRNLAKSVIGWVEQAHGAYYAAVQITGGHFVIDDNFAVRTQAYLKRCWEILEPKDRNQLYQLFKKYAVSDVQTVDQLLDRYYKPERYTGRGEQYANTLRSTYCQEYDTNGYVVITAHESITGQAVALYK